MPQIESEPESECSARARPFFASRFPAASLALAILSALAASPRQEGHKPVLGYFTTFPGQMVQASLIEEAYLYFECRHFKTIDGFGSNCLITGEIVAAYAEPEFLRSSEIDDQELVHDSPLFAYLAPGRFASIERSNAFPFPANMKK